LILSKIGTALKSQDWLTVAIEIAVIVVGLFLGLQVDGWRDRQVEAGLAQEYVERLYDDMVGTLEDHEINRGWDHERLCSQRVVLEALRSGVLAEADRNEFDRGLVFLGTHNPIRRRWGTIEELKSTGTMSILDIELRELIARAEGSYGRVDGIVSDQQAHMRQLRTQMMSSYETLTWTGVAPTRVTARYDFEALSADDEFIALFANAHLLSSMTATFVQNYMDQDVVGLRDHLASQLDVAPPPVPPSRNCGEG
jgi:hypothetical protein